MFGLNETIDKLDMANCVCWHDHVLVMTLDFDVEDRRKHGRP